MSVLPAEAEKLIEECISTKGVHLIDLEVRGEGQGKSLDVYIDSESGITTEVCSEVSRELGRLVETSGIVRGPYRLTVSSPGIARPLKFAWQYRKHIGRQLDLRVHSQEGTRTVVGKLISVDDTALVIGSGQGTDSLTFNDIVEARVKAPW